MLPNCRAILSVSLNIGRLLIVINLLVTKLLATKLLFTLIRTSRKRKGGRISCNGSTMWGGQVVRHTLLGLKLH